LRLGRSTAGVLWSVENCHLGSLIEGVKALAKNLLSFFAAARLKRVLEIFDWSLELKSDFSVPKPKSC
jgi:hypothetical protein